MAALTQRPPGSPCERAVTRIARRLAGRRSERYEHFRDALLILRAALLVACTVHLLRPILLPLDGVAYIALANVAEHLRSKTTLPARAVGDEKITVVYIDGPTHAEEYKGRSPLLREQLLRHLKILYSGNPNRLVAIDLDLSPTLEAIVGPEDRGQKELDDLIDKNAHRTILITPFPLDSELPEVFARKKLEWMVQRCDPKKEFTFAEPYLRTTFGFVVQYFDVPSGLGHAIAKRLRRERSRDDGPCEAARQSLQHNAAKDNVYLSNSWTSSYGAEMINFGALTKLVHTMPIKQFASGSDQREVEVVLFGANYGIDDLYLTPLGERYGVNVHAAIAASQLEPLQSREFLALLLDIVLGLAFGYLVHWAWSNYFEYATMPASRVTAQNLRRHRLAYRWLAGLIFGYALALLALIVLSFKVLQSGIWLSPIPIAFGMLVHGFAESSVTVAKEKLRKARSAVVSDDSGKVSLQDVPGHLGFVAEMESTKLQTVSISEVPNPHIDVNIINSEVTYRVERDVVARLPCALYIGIVGLALLDVVWEVIRH